VYLDPIIATREAPQKYHSPNGGHRLEAMRKLGAKAIPALVVPDRAIAWRILALNTEKAHALKEKALEVWRMETAMDAGGPEPPRERLRARVREAALLTLGAAYEKHGRLSGGAYRSPLKRVEAFIDAPLAEAIEIRRARGDKLLALDEKVSEIVAALKARGFQSPYLRQFVAARINPIRFAKTVEMTPEELLDAMMEKAEKFDVGAVKETRCRAPAATAAETTSSCRPSSGSAERTSASPITSRSPRRAATRSRCSSSTRTSSRRSARGSTRTGSSSCSIRSPSSRDRSTPGSRLVVVEGKSVDVVPRIARELTVDRVVAHRWSEPFARERDRRVAE
jgi:ParB family chromosome partitioning protein